MEMLGNRRLGVTQQQAWDALNDPETLKKCIPGCDRFELTGENEYSVGLALKIGPVSAKFSGKVTLADILAPDSYKLSFEGQGGVAGFGKGASSVTLTPNAAGCELAYTVQAQVGGKIAQLGQRLVDGAAKSMADDFFKRFDALMAERYPAPAAAVAANDEEDEGGTSFGSIDSLAPRTRPMPPSATSAAGSSQKWIWVVVAVVVAIGAYMYLRG
jgi:carbon monoxide dehydrogenase subunit G